MFSPVIKESSTPNDAACLELLLGLLTPDLRCKSLKMQGKIVVLLYYSKE